MDYYTYTANLFPGEKTGELVLRGGDLVIAMGQYALLTDAEVTTLSARFQLTLGQFGTPAVGTPSGPPLEISYIDLKTKYGLGNTTDDLSVTLPVALFNELARSPSSLEPQAVRTLRLELPSGDFKATAGIIANLTNALNAGSSSRRTRLHLVGQGPSNTNLFVQGIPDTDPMLWVHNGFLTLEGIAFMGDSVYAGALLRLGKQGASNGFLNQFKVDHCEFRRIGPGGKGVEIAWAQDGTFSNGGCFGHADGGIGVDFLTNGTDQHNCINFERFHIEEFTAGGACVRARSPGGGGAHHTIKTIGMHLETKSLGAYLLDLEGIHNWKFDAQMSQAKGPSSAVLATSNVPMVRLVNCYQIDLEGCNWNRSHPGGNADDWAHRPVAIGGSSRSLHLGKSFWVTGEITNPGVGGLWESDSTAGVGGTNVPFDNKTLPNFDGALVNLSTDRRKGPFFDTVEDTTSTSSRFWRRVMDATSKALLFKHGNTKVDWTNEFRTLALGKDGALGVRYITSMLQAVVANNGVQTFVLPGTNDAGSNQSFDNNTEKAGRFMVYSTRGTGGPAVAEFWSTGTAVYPVYIGPNAVLGETDPGTAGKLNVYLNAGNIEIVNRLGNTYTFGCLMFGVGGQGVL